MRTDALVFDIKNFLEGNRLLLTPVDIAEAAAETITIPVTAPAATVATTYVVVAMIPAKTVTIAVRLGGEE
jgi:hypothetical protein